MLAVPAHALGTEQAERFRALPEAKGLRVEIWRGRQAEDPQNLGSPMCGDLERVLDAQSIGLSAQTACCNQSANQSLITDVYSPASSLARPPTEHRDRRVDKHAPIP